MTLASSIFLWAVPALQFVLVVVFLRHRIFLRKFPAFFGYTCFAVGANVLQIVFLNHEAVFYWLYWGTEMVYGVVALLVMREVFGVVWDLKHGPRRFLVWIVILITAGISLLWGFYRPDGVGTLPAIHAAFRSFLTGVHLIEVVLFVVAIRLISKLTRYHLGIMLGFGVSASVQVLAYIAHFFPRGPVLREVITYVPLSAYFGSAGIWLSTFLTKPRVSMRLDPDEAIRWILEQDKIAREMSEDVGLSWPEENDSKNENRKNRHHQLSLLGPANVDRCITAANRCVSSIRISKSLF